MRKIYAVPVTILVLIFACKQHVDFRKPETIVEKSRFFPVSQYLLGQVKELDSIDVTPLKVTIINGKADSLWIKREDIPPLIKPFISPAIDSATYHTYFAEKSFLDQTINAFTFSYDPVKPLPDSMQIRHWDVYVDPATSKVNRIYIVKQLRTGNLPETMQLTWKPGYSCQLTTITGRDGGAPKIKEEKLIWNFDD